jgi:hypothetical protein
MLKVVAESVGAAPNRFYRPDARREAYVRVPDPDMIVQTVLRQGSVNLDRNATAGTRATGSRLPTKQAYVASGGTDGENQRRC